MAKSEKGSKLARLKNGGQGAAAPGKKSRQKAKSPPSGAGPGPAPTATTSRRRTGNFPIVCIGASAGGLDALKRFLSAMPAKSGMAIVLVPHLDPTHESLMVELLAKQTRIPVLEATHRKTIEPDHVYVIPPNKYLAVKNRSLQLSKPPGARGFHTAIDFALRSLAQDEGDAAIGIILSGTGNHGTLGLKEIKLAGGLVLVQDPDTAEFDQMPRSALATGLVDYVLPPEEMPAMLRSYVGQAHRGKKGEAKPETGRDDGLQRVLALLQTRSRYDFRYYRKNTISRRIQRRMALLQLKTMGDYVDYLRKNEDEVTALRKDLLIGVTTFFRDPDAFEALAKEVLPRLIDRADADSPVRIWVPGCATGEEAYSIAILLIEQFRAVEKAVNIQVFATDIDEDSLAVARQGIYPDTIATSLSRERLQRFFVRSDKHHYQVGKQLRDSIVFAPQNLISDAPFSRLDLISCRNLLIYLEPQVQEKVITLLHFALKEDGYLLLGPSETIGRATAMFEPVSKKWRLYHRIGPVRRELVSIPITASEEKAPTLARLGKVRRPAADFSQVMQKLLLEDFAPASVLVNRDYEILSVRGPLVNYLEFPPGEITTNLLIMARQGLRLKIRSACQKAVREHHVVTENDARVRRNGGYIPCTVTVRPLSEPKNLQGLLLIVFEDRAEPPASKATVIENEEEFSVVKQLEDELRATRSDLQGTIEELESSNEELKASNEEVMSMNEELQSTNEELETSKEELQSLNEELTTVNSQLQDKVEDLDSANNDLTNLMAATDIATVFLDTDLRIKRFTPPSARLLSLIATDVGRPIRDLAMRFQDPDLLGDARGVIDMLVPREKVVQTDENHWYLRRILPYRSADNRIGGVVVTLVDITQRMEAEAQARRLATVLRDSNDAVIVCSFEGRITAWNRGAEHMYGYSESEALGLNLRDLVPGDLKKTALDAVAQTARGDSIQSLETRRKAKDGSVLDVWLTTTALRDETGAPIAVATTERDITVRRQAEEEIRSLNVNLERRIAQRTAELTASENRIRSVLDAAVDAIITIDKEGTIQTFNAAAEQTFGYTAKEIIGRNVNLLMPSPWRDEHDEYLTRYLDTGTPHIIGKTRELRALRRDGTEFPMQLTIAEIPELDLFTGIIHDITDQKLMQDEILRIATLEQRRIGQELHDNTQQELTGLGLLARNLSDTLKARGDGPGAELAAKLAAGIADSNRHVQTIARGLVPVPVEAEGLKSALESLAQKTKELHGLTCHFECTEPISLANDIVATHLYRIAQEAVTNAIKHAKAREITIRLAGSESELKLEVLDDGIGISKPKGRAQGLGLRVMEHRCALVGGVLTVHRQDGGGTRVACAIPRSPGMSGKSGS